ncbi:hypothetical protein ABZT17_35085 [Streptomyces sp. NPDC005648]|uniref:hypothetical protein n=1 Tax=Streptomyces sp. NPDC005648 TaxID=3157044 RepID=UPI0033A5A09F
MAAVLTAAATLQCPHGAPLLVVPGGRLLTVDGHPVLTRADLLGATVPACPSTPPCGQVASVDAGLATTLRVGGEPVALETARGSTLAASPWQVVSAGQTTLEAT